MSVAPQNGGMATKRPALAVLTLEISDRTGKTIQLLPAGRFKAKDGRPASQAACSEWVCGPAQAQAVMAKAAQLSNPMVVDYEHQTLNAAENGQPAPAAGWFKNLEWRDGEGLFATDVEWTPAAASAIEAKEYRYISPVFSFDPETGDVQQMYMAALTNNPGLDGMQAVALSALLSPVKEMQMNPLLLALLKALGLNEQTPDDQALAALNAHLAKAQSDAAQVATLTTERVNKEAQIATLTAAVGNPDPAKFVPLSVVTELQGQVAALTSQVNGREVEETIQAALSNGQLLPALEGWARDLGKSNLAALKSYIANAPKIAALTGQQNGGRAPETPVPGAEGLDQATLAVCRMMGTDPAAVAKAKGVAK